MMHNRTFQTLFIVTALLFMTACGGESERTTNTALPVTAEVPSQGKILFKGNCAQCHALNVDRTGPMLSGVLQRWGNDTGHLMAFIKNSQAVIAKDGDSSYAGKLFVKWYKTSMPAYTQLSDEEIKELITYINAGKD